MQHVEIPAGIERDPVVGQHQLTSLQVGQSAQDNDWHFGESQLARGREPAMTGDDVAFRANEYGIRKPECLDAAGDLRDLRVVMRARVARRRDEPRYRPHFQTQAIDAGYRVSAVHFVARFIYRLVARPIPLSLIHISEPTRPY